MLAWILYNEQSRKESIAILQCTIENGNKEKISKAEELLKDDLIYFENKLV